MKRLAFYTIGFLHEPVPPSIQEFVDLVPVTHQVAAQSPGYIDIVTMVGAWGDVVYPSFVAEAQKIGFIYTYSLWRDVQSVYAFTYSGRHAQNLGRRSDWFGENAYPGFVAWWVAENHRPGMAEAAARIEQLHAHGPRPDAFNFRRPFDAAGDLIKLDRKAVNLQ